MIVLDWFCSGFLWVFIMSLILYRKQREVLEFLKDFIVSKGYGPTIREIAAGIGLTSPATVEEHLQALEHKGVIRRIRGKARAIEINPEFGRAPGNKIPILGQIMAGEPIEAIEDPDSHVDFPIHNSPEEHFALRVKGRSMVEDGIFDGDVVIIRRQETCQNGDTVVALLEDGSATLKRLFREKKRIRLQPANPDFKPIHVHKAQIQGRVVGLVRKF